MLTIVENMKRQKGQVDWQVVLDHLIERCRTNDDRETELRSGLTSRAVQKHFNRMGAPPTQKLDEQESAVVTAAVKKFIELDGNKYTILSDFLREEFGIFFDPMILRYSIVRYGKLIAAANETLGDLETIGCLCKQINADLSQLEVSIS